MSANAYPLIEQMASDSCSILIAGCDYTDEWLSEPLSLLYSSSFFFFFFAVGGSRCRVFILFRFITPSPSVLVQRRRRSMDERENPPLTEGKGKKWAVWKITAKVENKPLLEVRCAFCVAKEDWGGGQKRGKERARVIEIGACCGGKPLCPSVAVAQWVAECYVFVC